MFLMKSCALIIVMFMCDAILSAFVRVLCNQRHWHSSLFVCRQAEKNFLEMHSIIDNKKINGQNPAIESRKRNTCARPSNEFNNNINETIKRKRQKQKTHAGHSLPSASPFVFALHAPYVIAINVIRLKFHFGALKFY